MSPASRLATVTLSQRLRLSSARHSNFSVGLLGRQLTTPIGNEWLCDFGVFSLLFSGSGTGSINASLVLANLAASATTRASTIQQEGNIMNPEERVQMLLGAKPNSWVALSHDESKVVGTGST